MKFSNEEVLVLYTGYCQDNQTKEDQMAGICGTDESGANSLHAKLVFGNLKRGDHMEDLGIR
jgi:hypothetical protein